MTKMYVYTRYGDFKIVEVERVNEKSVWCNGRRESRVSGMKSYFETFEELKEHAVSKARAKLDRARANLDIARAKLRDAEAIKDPTAGS